MAYLRLSMPNVGSKKSLNIPTNNGPAPPPIKFTANINIATPIPRTAAGRTLCMLDNTKPLVKLNIRIATPRVRLAIKRLGTRNMQIYVGINTLKAIVGHQISQRRSRLINQGPKATPKPAPAKAPIPPTVPSRVPTPATSSP